MSRRKTTPFAKGPRTHQYKRPDGTTVLTVSICELTPWRAKVADRGALLSALVLFCFTIYAVLIATAQTWQAWLAAVGLPLLAYPLILLTYRYLLAKPVLMELHP